MTAEDDEAEEQETLGVAVAGIPRLPRLSLPNDSPLVIVSGCVGSGKTTLLRQWFDETNAASSREAVWLPVVDNADGFFEALERVTAQSQPPATVFVDDIDRITTHSTHRETLQATVGAVASADADVQLVLVTRGLPTFALGPLRIANLVADVNDRQLQFTGPEMSALARLYGVTLDSQLAEQVARLTEGWALGLASMFNRLAISDRSQSSALAGSRWEEAVTDVSEATLGLVTARFSTTDVDLLAQTSLLETLTLPLCEAVADDGIGPNLGRLHQEGLPMTPIDRAGEAYRLHPILRRGLQDRVTELEDPDVVAGRHARAADELHRAGELRLATEHYLAAGRDIPAADMLARRWSAARSSVTVDDLVAFENLDLERYVPHVVTVGLVKGDYGDLEAVKQALAVLAEEQWPGSLPHGFNDLEVAIVELELLFPTRDGERSERIAEVMARPSADVGDPPLVNRYTAAHYHYYLGQFDEARRIVEEILVGHLSIGRHTRPDRGATVLASNLKALLCHDSGSLDEAQRFYTHSIELIDRYGLTDLYPSAKQVLALTRALIDEQEPAVRFELIKDVAEDGSDVFLRTHAGIELVKLMDRQRRHEQAVTYLKRVETQVAGISLPGMLSDRLRSIAGSFHHAGVNTGPSLSVTWSERSVLHLLADEQLSQAEISQMLDLSINTVKSHLRSIYQKFGANNREQAVQHAAEVGLLASVLPWVAAR